MASTHVDYTAMEWTSAVPFYGPAAVQDGKDIVQLKVLSDRRSEGGGIAWLVKFSPPPGKLIKIVATALSDRLVRRAHLLTARWPQHQERPARARIGRLRVESQGPAAQRHDQQRDRGAGDLCGRARRDQIDGDRRHCPGRLVDIAPAG